MIDEPAASVVERNDGILTTLLTTVHEIVERIADGEVELEIWQVGLLPIVVMVEGTWILNWEFWRRILVVENVILSAIADSTVVTSALIITFDSKFGEGVTVNEPIAILLPPRDIWTFTRRGEVSTRHCAMKLDSYILWPTEISESVREAIVNLYWVELLVTDVRPISFVV